MSESLGWFIKNMADNWGTRSREFLLGFPHLLAARVTLQMWTQKISAAPNIIIHLPPTLRSAAIFLPLWGTHRI